MPYFYKLSDYSDYWLNTVRFTKNIIKNSCKEKYNNNNTVNNNNNNYNMNNNNTMNNNNNSNIKIIILRLIPSSLTRKTIKNNKFLSQFFTYEYFTQNGINKNNILHILTFEEFEANLQALFEYNILENYFIHITCTDNINSIQQRGLLSETEINNENLRTVNYENNEL